MDACDGYREQISACLDGALGEGERWALMEHLAACEGCRRYFDDQLAIQAALSGLEAPAPEGFTARVMAQVRAETGPAPVRRAIPFPGWRRWAALAACCAVVCLGIWGSGVLAGPGQADTAVSRQAAEDTAAPEEAPAAARAGAGEDGSAAPAAEPAAAEPSAQSGGGVLDEAGPYAGDAQPVPAEAPEAALSAQSGDEAEPYAGDARPAPSAKDISRDAAGARMLTAEGPAARAWVEGTLGLSWEPGAVYTLTEEQYLELSALLMEAGERFAESSEEGEGWLLAASGQE